MDLRSAGSIRANTASITEIVSAAVFPASRTASVTRDLRSWRTSTGRVRLQMMRSPSQWPPCDVAADVILRSVGVQRDLGSVEHHQQLGFVGVEPCEQTIEGDKAGLALEDAFEPCPQGGLALFGGSAAIGLEIAVELPDQLADGGLSGAVLVGESVELVNQALGMDPAQAVLADVELTGVIADDHGVGQEA